jgi:hypothetical protein
VQSIRGYNVKHDIKNLSSLLHSSSKPSFACSAAKARVRAPKLLKQAPSFFKQNLLKKEAISL